MPILIEVNDTHIKQLTEFYIQRLKVLRDEIIEREKESKEINATIQKLRKTPSASERYDNLTRPLSTEYSDKWPWAKKVQFAIKEQGKPLTTKDIVDVLTEYETTFIYDRKRAIASISSVLSSKFGDGKEFGRIESESGDFAYYINDKVIQQTITPNIENEGFPF